VLRWLITSRLRLREEKGFSESFAWQAFARLALAMVNGEDGKRSILDLEEGAVAVDEVMQREFSDQPSEERRRRAREWLRFECLGSGIVEEVAGNRIRFWHLTFQEFFAALQLAWRGDGEDPEEDWWPLVRKRLEDSQWRETIELFPGCLLDEGGVGRVDRLLNPVLSLRGTEPDLATLRGTEPDLATDARVAGIVSRLLQPLSVYQYRPRPEIADAYRNALERSLAIFTVEGATEVPVKIRIAAAEILGRAGDPRLAEGHDHFIEVSGCGGLHLAKYPVTVEEYQRFVEQRGCEEERFWGAAGWSAKSQGGWEAAEDWQEQLGTPNRPVVAVSWWELQEGREVRLHTESEWRQAAQPIPSDYPWGEAETDAERANFSPDMRPTVGSAMSVGVLPAGDVPFGHSDLASNVWGGVATI